MTQAVATGKFYVYISGAWTLLTDTGKAQSPRFSWGMAGNTPLDRLADVGEATFTLKNPTGVYTPGSASALAGWRKGIPFKWVVTYENEDHVRFRGYISNIRIPKRNTDKNAYITVVDWLDYANKHPIINPGIQTNKRGDEVLTTTANLVAVAPQYTDFDQGAETFPTVFDTNTSHTTAYAEFGKVAFSEVGFVYLKKDGTYGETLRFESANSRYGWRTADQIPNHASDSGLALNEDGGFALNEDGTFVANNELFSLTFDGSIILDFDAPYGENVINRMTVYAYPRKLDTSAQVLFNLDNEIVISSGQSYTLKGYYANPSGGLQINGQDMITPVATTDYTMFTATGGGGSDITADLSISITYGTEGFTATLTNNNAYTGYVNKFQTRGTGIYYYNPIEHAVTNSDSIDEFEAESETLHQKYKNNLYAGSVFVNSQVEQFKDPRVVLRSVTFCANSSLDNMQAFLYGDVGNLYYFSIPELNTTGNYYIQGVEVNLIGGLIMVKWILMLALSLQTGCGLTPLAVEYGAQASGDAVNFGFLPHVYSDSTPETISYSIWYNLNGTSWGGDLMGTGSDPGGLLLTLDFDPSPVIVIYENVFSSGLGNWTKSLTPVAGQWVHIVMTFDISSASNEPILYINGASQTLTKNLTPSGSKYTKNGLPIIIGNRLVAASNYGMAFDGKIFDPRVYNKILSQAEVDAIYNSGTPDASAGLHDTSLVFQAFAVRSGDTADYVDQTLDSTLKLFDAQHLSVGTVHGSPIGRAAP